MHRLHQRTYEKAGLRTEVWLENPTPWHRTVFALETGPHRSTQVREPTDADIARHRKGAK